MARHNTNSILKYVVPVILGTLFILYIISWWSGDSTADNKAAIVKEVSVKNTAAQDSASESLDTLTADLSETKQKISAVSKDSEALKRENEALKSKLADKESDALAQLTTELQALKGQIEEVKKEKNDTYPVDHAVGDNVITIINDVSQPVVKKEAATSSTRTSEEKASERKSKSIPYYTIPANATAVKVRLMTALVGRIPVKGVVVDPYPFKVLLSDDNLAANGLRIPHLLQMVVSGYCEGDLGLLGVRGWVTSLTFVFDDGTISSTTSNNNDVGNFTKANALGYLSDNRGNPFIPGMKFISNAPLYLGGNIALGSAVGAANAYAQKQTTTTTSFLGNGNTSVTGSQAAFVAGQSISSGANEALQWWKDREQQSFDAVYVAPTDANGQYVEIAVNFSKEIAIDYNQKGRKLSYAHHQHTGTRHLD